MATLNEIVKFLDATLEPGKFQDSSFNGLQVESSAQEVKKVAVSVDAGESVFDAAVAEGAQLLIVHHGLMWGHPEPISGIFGRKIRKLLSGGCSLYASHLPLDGHPNYGNNALLAKFYGLHVTGTFCSFGGADIGVVASAPTVQNRDSFVERSKTMIGALTSPLLLPFGPDSIRTVGIVSGSGADAIFEASHRGLDLLISGESKQSAFHTAKEHKCNVLFAGHYATETFGVRALGDLLASSFGTETTFIDEPTGI